MYALGLDVETTGLNCETDEITEIGAVLWDTNEKKPIAMVSELVKIEAQITEKIYQLTGITNDMLDKFGKPLTEVMEKVDELVQHADYFVAHNAPFDNGFLAKAGIQDRPWIDTRVDLPLEAYTKGKSASLGYLAADHGFINPFPHRAVTDVLTMLTLMGKYDFNFIKDRGSSPVKRVVAAVSFHNRDKAKGAGFYWDPNNKEWFREIKECDLGVLRDQWDFGVRVQQ